MADIEMLQNPFHEGVQWKTKTIVKSDFKETNHPRHIGRIKSQNIRGPYSDTRGRSIAFGKGNPIRRIDLARPHSHSMLNGRLKVI